MNNSLKINQKKNLDCSCLIIGSGPGGLTAAKRLIEAGFEVMIIEEGDFIKTSESQKFKNYQKISSLWRNGGITTGFGKTSVLYAEGKAVGGGAEINSGIMQKVTMQVINEWVKNNDIKKFSPEILNCYYEKVFSTISPIQSTSHPSSKILFDAGRELGWKVENLEIAYDKDGNKNSVSKILLDDLLKKGLQLFSNVKAQKIRYKNGKAYEIEALSLGKYPINIKFDYLFLAAGAIYSPFLLLKSGIKKSVGKTLQFHPTLKVGALFENKINESPALVPGSAITEFAPDIRIGGSVFTKGFWGMFLSENWQKRSWMFPLSDYCGIYYAMIRSEGKAQIFKLPFLPDPLITIKLTERDYGMLESALDKLIRVMFAAKAKYIYSSVFGDEGLSSYQKIKITNRKNLNLMTIHAFSSLPMGEKDFCPVDSFGRLKQLSNVTICDASIIPSAPGTNPQATIMALVERNIDYFITQLKVKNS